MPTEGWNFKTGSYIESSPVIGSDGTIYIGSDDYYLYAISPDGTEKWSFATGSYVESAPAIGPDGTIYVGSWDDNLYAINPNGTRRWTFTTIGVPSSPTVGPDGTIYVGTLGSKLYAISPNGEQKWNFQTWSRVDSSPAVGSDGTVYVASYEHRLEAVNGNGTLKWARTFDAYFVASAPTIGPDGTIYLGGDGKMYAVHPDGTLKWSFITTTGSAVESSPAIGSDGTAYFGDLSGNFYAVKQDGSMRWNFSIGYTISSSPSIGSDGTIYVGSYDHKLYAINPDGTEKWTFQTGGYVQSSPAIGSEHMIYVGSYDHRLYAIGRPTRTTSSNTGGSFYRLQPNLVIGQSNFTLSGCTNSILCSPSAITFDSVGDLWVVYPPRTVVEYTPPFSNGMDVSVQISHAASFSSKVCGPNVATIGMICEWVPVGLAFDASGNMWVVDGQNSRVLKLTPPFHEGMSASLVIGQSNLTSSGCSGGGFGNPTRNGLCYPSNAAFDADGDLWVADFSNSRVLEYKPPFSNGMNASIVIGQRNFNVRSCYYPLGGFAGVGSLPTRDSLCFPNGLAFDKSGNLWVSDFGNNRAVEYSSPFSDGQNATMVIGQPNFASNSCSGGPNHLPGRTGLCTPRILAFDESGGLWVSEYENNRVLQFAPSFHDGMNASLVIGQPDFRSNDAECDPVKSNGLCHPRAITVDSSGDLWIADTANNRILRFASSTSSSPQGENVELYLVVTTIAVILSVTLIYLRRRLHVIVPSPSM